MVGEGEESLPVSGKNDLPDIVDLVMEMGQPAPRVPAHVEELVETAREYADNATSENTRDAYAKDWKHFTSWCRRNGFDPLPPEAKVIGLYISACAAGGAKLGAPALSVSTIERRLSGLSWNFTQRGLSMDRADRHISTVLAGIRRKHARPPRVKEAVLSISSRPSGPIRLRQRVIVLASIGASCWKNSKPQKYCQ